MLMEVTTTLSLIDFNAKYIWAISLVNINTGKDLRLISLKNTRDMRAKYKKKFENYKFTRF